MSALHIIQLRKTVAQATSIPYEKMARAIFGARYELSLVVCGDDLAKRINAQYRRKSYSPNVLSFPYGTYEGEIFLNVRKAEREAKSMGISVRSRMALLFVHGCFHLKGYHHGVTMEKLEQKILRAFGF